MTSSLNNPIKEFFDSKASNWSLDNKIDDRIKTLLRRIGIKEGDAVLDVACGCGVITSYLHELSNSHVDAIDLSPKMIEEAKKQNECNDISFECADFYSFDKNKQYDAIVVYNAYPHFTDVEAFKTSAIRLLKDGGRLAIVHSLSRKELDSHHNGLGPNISRSLNNPSEEGSCLSPLAILVAEESVEHYIVLVQKPRRCMKEKTI